MANYQDYLDATPPNGDVDHGEIQIRPISQANPQMGPHGLVFSDDYVTVLRHPVLFPSLSEGSYTVVHQGVPGQKVYGAVILPLHPRAGEEPEVAWVRQYRPACNGWMLELPRGGVGSHEEGGMGALREVREETGLGTPDLLLHLGDMVNDSGLSPTQCGYYVAVYMRSVTPTHRSREAREAISEVFWAPMSRWMELAQQPPTPGRVVGGLDSFTQACFGLATTTGVLRTLEQAWDAVLDQTLYRHDKLAPAVQEWIRAGKDDLGLRLHCNSLRAARRIAHSIPLNLRQDCTSEDLILKDLSPLAISWLAHHPDVISIEGL